MVTAVRYLRQRFPDRPVVLVGDSLGSAAAIFAAKELDGEVAGYFLEAPYRDLHTALWDRVNVVPPPLNWIAYQGMTLWGGLLLPENPDVISPIDHVADIPSAIPVTFVAGRGDMMCKLEEVEAQYRKIEGHARLVVIDSAAHGQLSRNHPREYDAALLDLLSRTDTTLAPRRGAAQAAPSVVRYCRRLAAGVP